MCLDFLLHIVQPKQRCNTLNAEADGKIQLSSIEPESKDIFKNIKQSHVSYYNIFKLENTLHVIYAIIQWVHFLNDLITTLFKFSFLISNMV